MRKLIAAVIAMGLMAGLAADANAAPQKKKVKAGLTSEEKAALRKKYMPICVELYGDRGSVRVFKVHVYSDGRVVCWYRG